MELISPQIIALILVVGGLAGFLAGLLGIGGGVILVPMFLWLFPLAGFPAEHIVHVAFATSLAIILPTSISSVLNHRLQGNVAWNMVFFLVIGGVVGSLGGASLASILPGEKLKLAFALLMIAVSLKLLFYKQKLEFEEISSDYKRTPLILVGFVGGFASAFFGIGGGVVAVPLMLMLLRVPIILAVGNSSALIVVSSFAAVCCYIYYGWDQTDLPPFSLGYVNLLVAAIIAPASMLAARQGVKLASRTSQAKLVRAFAVLLMIVGVKILLGF
jgi:uncharacterized membrane protein YfcA